MDSVVSSPELVHEILEWGTYETAFNIRYMFEHGSGNTYRDSGHGKMMACCARVSQIWSYEACSILWSEQYGLTNLVRLLEFEPLDSASEGRLPISRFLHNASFVKCIISDDGDFQECNAIYKAQAHPHAAGRTMFPAIQVLDLRQTEFLNSSTVDAASCLFGSSLQQLILPRSPPEIRSLTLTKAINCSGNHGLMKFSMEGVTASHDDRFVFCNFIRTSASLKYVTVHISWLDYEGMQSLGKLHHLSRLELLDRRPIPPLSDPLNRQDILNKFSPSDGTLFASLKDLNLDSYSFVAKTLLDTAFAHTRLRKFHVHLILTLEDIDNPTVLPLAPIMNIQDLVDVNVIFGGDPVANIFDDVRIPRLDRRTLDALSSCGSLESLSIWHPRMPKLTDADILSLARHWPSLKNLDLRGVAVLQRQVTPQTTLAILEHLPKLCPGLKELRMAFAGVAPELRPAHNHSVSLQTVTFETSFVFDPNSRSSIKAIAAYIKAVLPPSCKVWYYPIDAISHPGVSDNEWDEIAERHMRSNQEIAGKLGFANVSFGVLPRYFGVTQAIL